MVEKKTVGRQLTWTNDKQASIGGHKFTIEETFKIRQYMKKNNIKKLKDFTKTVILKEVNKE